MDDLWQEFHSTEDEGVTVRLTLLQVWRILELIEDGEVDEEIAATLAVEIERQKLARLV